MKKLLLVLSAMLWCVAANATITVADNNINQSGGTITAGSAASVGDLYCVGTQGSSSGVISDTLNGLYTSFKTVTTGFGDVLHMGCVVVTTAGTPTISSTGTVGRINFIRYHGFASAATIISADSASNVGVGTSLASPPFNASQNSEICWGIFDNGGTVGTISGQFGTSGLYSGNYLGQAETSQVGLISSGTSISLTISYSTSATWGVMVQCFYDGAPAVPRPGLPSVRGLRN